MDFSHMGSKKKWRKSAKKEGVQTTHVQIVHTAPAAVADKILCVVNIEIYLFVLCLHLFI